MFFDVRLTSKKEGKSTVIVRKVFPKKRKHNKVAGLERNYVSREKKYFVTSKKCFSIPDNGRFSAVLSGESVVIKLFKGDKLIITSDGTWNIISSKKHRRV